MGVNDRAQDKQEAKKNGARLSDFRFINYDLSSEDKEQLKSMDCAFEFTTEVVEGLVQEGYKYSLTYDPNNHSFIASLTDKSPGSDFINACLSGRGSSAANARYSLLYRHLVVSQGDWGVFGSLKNPESPEFG